MRTTKIIVSIASILLFVLVMFQSCTAGMYNALEKNGETSGTAGMVVAFLMLISGIAGLCTKDSKGGTLTVSIFYFLAGLIGISSAGAYKDLILWGSLCLIFGVIYFISARKMKKAVSSANS